MVGMDKISSSQSNHYFHSPLPQFVLPLSWCYEHVYAFYHGYYGKLNPMGLTDMSLENTME